MSDALCLAQLAERRRQQPQRGVFDSEEDFPTLGQLFAAPGARQDFTVKLITHD